MVAVGDANLPPEPDYYTATTVVDTTAPTPCGWTSTTPPLPRRPPLRPWFTLHADEAGTGLTDARLTLQFYNNAGSTHLVADLMGYYAR